MTEPKGNKRFALARDLLDEVRGVLFGAREGEEMAVPNVWGRLALEIYSRTRSHLEAVRILVEAEFPDDAVLLVRELLVDSLRLMELTSRSDEDRFALAFGWYNESLTRLEGLGHEAVSVGLPRAHEWAPGVKQRRQEHQSAWKSRGIKWLESFGDEKQLAKRHGRERETWDYRFYSEIVHRPDLALAFRSRWVGPDAVHIYLKNRDPDFRAAVLAGAMSSAIHGHKAVAAMLGWSETSIEDLDHLLQRLDALFPDAPGGVD
jgi:hypothetical protein